MELSNTPSHYEYLTTSIVQIQRNIIVLELDERFFQREVLHPRVVTKSQAEQTLAQVQTNLKMNKAKLEFFQSVVNEYAPKPTADTNDAGKVVS